MPSGHSTFEAYAVDVDNGEDGTRFFVVAAEGESQALALIQQCIDNGEIEGTAIHVGGVAPTVIAQYNYVAELRPL